MSASRGIVTSLTILWASCSSAQELDRIAACKAIENEVARLNCFDAVAATLDPQVESSTSSEALPQEELTDNGNWKVESGVDPLTDKETFLAAVDASNGSSFRRPALLIRCNGGVSEFFIAWGDYLGDNTRVTSRFGTNAPETFSWEGATDKTATFLSAARHKGFLNSLMKTDRFVARIEPYQSGPIAAVFEVSGIEAILRDKATVCGIEID